MHIEYYITLENIDITKISLLVRIKYYHKKCTLIITSILTIAFFFPKINISFSYSKK